MEYLVTVRESQLSKVGYVTTGYYGGLALGRLILAEPTYRLGERRMLLLYSAACLGLQLVFWRVKNVIADAVAVSCMGFLLGPCFATVSLVVKRGWLWSSPTGTGSNDRAVPNRA